MNVNQFEKHFGPQQLKTLDEFWLIYFLVDESREIVYVGKTSNIKFGERIKHHRKSKRFSSYFVKTGPRDEGEAYKLEGAFITLIRPKYNKTNIIISANEIKTLYDWMTGKMETDRPEIELKSAYKASVLYAFFTMLFLLLCFVSFNGFFGAGLSEITAVVSGVSFFISAYHYSKSRSVIDGLHAVKHIKEYRKTT